MGGRVTKSNLPQAVALRWNVEKAAAELGLSIGTLRKALNMNSARPGQDGCYSNQEIVGSIFGELHREKVRTQRALAQKVELENAITTASVLNRADLEKGQELGPGSALAGGFSAKFELLADYFAGDSSRAESGLER